MSINPPPIIVDSNLSWKYVKELIKAVPGEVFYVNDPSNNRGLHSHMRDQEIMEKREEMHGIIITQNGKDFQHGDVISLKSRKPANYLIKQTLTELKKHKDYSEYLKPLKLRY